MQDYNKYFEVGDKIQLEMMYGFEREPYVSQIIEFYDNGILDVLTPIHKGRVVYFRNDSIIKVILSKNEAVYQINVKILEKTFGQIPMMRLEIVSDISKIQRRDFYRLRLIKEITYRKAISLKEKTFTEKFKGNLLDISGGGLMFNSPKEWQEQDMIEITLNLASGKILTLMGVIVRKIYHNDIKYCYEYGIRFEGISEQERNEITKFIFEEQRKLVKKGLI